MSTWSKKSRTGQFVWFINNSIAPNCLTKSKWSHIFGGEDIFQTWIASSCCIYSCMLLWQAASLLLKMPSIQIVVRKALWIRFNPRMNYHSQRHYPNWPPEVPCYSNVQQTVKCLNLENNQDLLLVLGGRERLLGGRDCGHIPHKGFPVLWWVTCLRGLGHFMTVVLLFPKRHQFQLGILAF